MSETRHGTSGRIIGYIVAGAGIAFLLATLPFYLASGLMAPLWAIVVLLLVWLALFILAIRWFRSRPWWVPALPLVAVAFWFGAMSAGEMFLGWSA